MQRKSIHILLEPCQHTLDIAPWTWRRYTMSANYDFQPRTVKALAEAFHKSWGFISKDPYFATKNPALLQRRLSECLMQLAADGEYDALRLAKCAIKPNRPEFTPKAPGF